VADNKDIGSQLLGVEDLASKIGDRLSQFAGVTDQFAVLLGEAVKEMKELDGEFSSVYDFLEKINKNSTLFQNIQNKSGQILQEKIVARYHEIYDTQEEINQAMKDGEEEIKSYHESLSESFDVLKNMKTETEQIEVNFENVTKVLDELGSSIRSPSQGMEGMLSSLGDLPDKLTKARSESEGWGEALGKVASESRLGKLVQAFKVGGLLVIGIAAVAAGLTILYKLFKNYYEFLDKNVVPAQAEFAKQIGNTSTEAKQLSGQMTSMGVRFEYLGRDFAEGAALVRDFADGMSSVKPFDKETMLVAENLVGVLGVSGREAGKLSLMFEKNQGSLKGLNAAFVEGGVQASKWNVPVAQVQKDMAEAPEVMARFGTSNVMEFGKAAAAARSYGLNVKEVNAAFGEQMDSFEGTSDAAAKLNSIFGTNINSMELMMETDSQKRLEMLREELVAQGKEWGNLNEFEQNLITTSLNVDKTQAMLFLGSEKQRKSAEKAASQKKRDIDVQKQWDRGINRTQKTLLAWGKILDGAMRAVTELVSAMFGFEKPGKNITSITQKIQKFMIGKNGLVSKTKDFAEAWREGGDALGPVATTFKFLIESFKLGIKVVGFLLTKGFMFTKWLADATGITDSLRIAVDAVKVAMEYWAPTLDSVMKDMDTFANTDIDWGLVWEGFKIEFFEVMSEVGAIYKKWLWDKPKEWVGMLIDFIKTIPEKVGQIDLGSLFGGGAESSPTKPGSSSIKSVGAGVIGKLIGMTGIPGAGAAAEKMINIVLEVDGKALSAAQVNTATGGT